MSKKQNKKFITPEILRGAVKGAFVKLNPRYMMRNPVMFVVEIGCFITLLLSFFPGLFGDVDAGSLRIYDIIVCVILFITVLFANFAEAVAEGRGKAQAASLKKTQKDTEAHLLHEDGSETIVRSSELKKGDIVLVVAGEVIPGDGEVIEGIASVDDIFACVENGGDTFDCVAPARCARNGAIYTRSGRYNIKRAQHKFDFGPLEEGCDCYTCRHYSRAYVDHLLRAREFNGFTLATIHNEHFFVKLLDDIRASIDDGYFDEFRDETLARFYANGSRG